MNDAQMLQWRVHPLVQEPRLKSALLCLALAAFPAMATVSFGGALYGFISFAVLAGAVSRYLFPTRYRLDRSGVETEHLWRHRRRPWTEFCRARVRGDGLFLSPFERPHRLDSFRGEFIRCDGNRERVSSFVRAHVSG